MSPRRPNPRALDVARFAAAGVPLEGEWPLAELARVAAGLAPEAPPGPQDRVRWRVEGESRPRLGGDPVVHLRLQASTRLALSCQRCLGPVMLDLEVDRRTRFVATEAEAEALDAEIEDDVMAWARRLDLLAWAEDELLLAQPLVPRHGRCPAVLPGAEAAGVGAQAPEGEDPAGEPSGEAEAKALPRPQPFAALAALRPAADAPEPVAPARPPRRRGGRGAPS